MSDSHSGFSIEDRARIRFWSSVEKTLQEPEHQGQGADAVRVPCGAPPPALKEQHG